MLKDVKVREDEGSYYFSGISQRGKIVTFAVLSCNGVLLLTDGCPADCGLSITDIHPEFSFGRIQVCKPDGAYI